MAKWKKSSSEFPAEGGGHARGELRAEGLFGLYLGLGACVNGISRKTINSDGGLKIHMIEDRGSWDPIASCDRPKVSEQVWPPHLSI